MKETDIQKLQAHGSPLWVNVRALADSLRDPARHTPHAYLEKQADDDLCVLMVADKTTIDGLTIKRLQDALKARNEEIQVLRELYRIAKLPDVASNVEAVNALATCTSSIQEIPLILKGVGKVNGDGWKDTTRLGEIVYVWNIEKPAPYVAGQYPRIGYSTWTASRDQYDFTPATSEEARCAVEHMLATTS